MTSGSPAWLFPEARVPRAGKAGAAGKDGRPVQVEGARTWGNLTGINNPAAQDRGGRARSPQLNAGSWLRKSPMAQRGGGVGGTRGCHRDTNVRSPSNRSLWGALGVGTPGAAEPVCALAHPGPVTPHLGPRASGVRVPGSVGELSPRLPVPQGGLRRPHCGARGPASPLFCGRAVCVQAPPPSSCP